ncbi:MAG: NADP-dependent oxidoreductase [Myxococcales bacterium SG8_38_1]|nr:MAG: NADP-dependent oxidoreductase [Myxococcales bacterium SG8_38_1]
MQVNRQILLKKRPVGVPEAGNFEAAEGPMLSPGPGEVLLKNLYLSIDPAIRGWMSDAKSYLPPIQIGAPVRSGTLSQIIESNADAWPVGQIVQALATWESYSVVPAHQLHGRVEAIKGIPLPSMLSVLGGNGLTAYFGLLEIGQPKEGETVLVSAAAGGVGSIAGQIARIKGCRAVGLTGSDEKCAWLVDELGYHAAVNYKTADLRIALEKACPKGIDVFFDSVGGEILNTVLTRLNRRGRVALCGAISQINATELPPGPSNYLQLLAKSARMEGFTTLDFARRYDEARADLARWIREGKLSYRDEIIEGIEQAPAHLLRLFSGEHRGKLMVKLADPEV